MPRLKRLIFHIPMSSPQSMRIFGLLALAISISFDELIIQNDLPGRYRPTEEQLHETQQHGDEGKHADQDQEHSDRNDRGLQSLLRHACDGRETSAPQVTNRPMV